jgi:lipid-A-disaccharide synthase
MAKNRHILISAGEASGDLHGAKLIKALKKIEPDLKISAMGGKQMQQAGADIVVDIKGMSVMGLFDVLAQLPRILRALFTMRDYLRQQKPDLLIVIDYSGFHLRLIKYAKQAGVKVLYFIPPQLWASRTHRIKTVRKYVDKIAVIMPFEVDFYRKHGMEAVFVGHPLRNDAVTTMSVDEMKQKYGLSSKRIVGLFPGSRHAEIKKMLPAILKSARLIKQQFPTTEFVMPLASTLSRDEIEPYFAKYDLKVNLIEDNIYNVIQLCEAIIAVSGTVTVQIALMQIPMVIIYKINPPYFPLQFFVKTGFLGLCNIMAQKGIVKEFWQQHVTANNIYHEIYQILTDKKYSQQMRKELAVVQKGLTSDNHPTIDQVVFDLLEG